jgi:hypothetical protein
MYAYDLEEIRSMWTTEHSELTDATPEAVFAVWSDTASWPSWDDGLEHVRLDGPFAAGSRGRVKPKGGPGVSFTMLSVSLGAGFTSQSRLPLGRMRFEHRAEPEGPRTRVTHRVTIEGPATPLFSRVIGRGVARDLPAAIRALIAVAERRCTVPA